MLPPPPPSIVDLPAGTRLVAGLGYSTVLPDIDLETYSEAGYVFDGERWQGPPGAPGTKRGLEVVGVDNYARHPTARTVWLAYNLKDGRGQQRWRPGLPPPLPLWEHVMSGGLLEAWNAAFERTWWRHVLHGRLGWPAIRNDQWRCAMAKARAYALPGALGKAGPIVGADTLKDEEGSKLIKVFCMPRQPTQGDSRLRVLPVYNPAEALPAAIAQMAVDAGPSLTTRRFGTLIRHAVERVTTEHQQTMRFGDYNGTDIDAEAEISARVPDIEGEELEWWLAHEEINEHGVYLDREAVENCIAVVEQAFARYHGELLELTGIDSATKVAQLQAWLRARGVHLESLDEDAVEAALGYVTDRDVRRVLEIRAAVGSASVKKLYAMRNRVSPDGYLRDLYLYHAARTGRSTGADVQPTNMPKAGPNVMQCGGCGKHHGTHLSVCPHCSHQGGREIEWNPDVVETALAVIARRSLEWLEYVFGTALPVIAGCLRGLFIAAPGHDLMGGDFSSIEAIGLAMISGESWRIEVFRGDGKIYERSASETFGVPYDEIIGHKKRTGQHHPLRQKGKIGELAYGYQGWVGAARAFGVDAPEDELKQDILRWRAASPAIEWLWGGQTRGKASSIVRNALRPGYAGGLSEVHRYAAEFDKWDSTPMYFGVEGAAIEAMLYPDRWFSVRRLNGTDSGIAFRTRLGVLYCRLPSGRLLTYHSPRLDASDRGGWALSYEGWNTNAKNGPVGWIRMNTWGGRLVENIIQATCRDVLRRAVLNLRAVGYRTVLHVYDEIVCQVPQGWGDAAEFERLMTTPAPWYADWPVRAPDPFRDRRYGKR